MTRNRDLANVLTAANSLSTDAETAAAISSYSASLANANTFASNQTIQGSLNLTGNSTNKINVSSKFTVDTSNAWGAISLARQSGQLDVLKIQGTDSTGTANVLRLANASGNGSAIDVYHDSLRFYVESATTERMRISAGGRLLIGKTTDDAYNSFQLHTGFGLNGVGGYYSELNHNLIYNGGWKNAAQGPSSQIVMQGGANLASAITFFTDPSSLSTAAGSNSGVVERMRIDAAGKVFLSGIARDTSSQIRNITLSTSGASGGNDGDVWLTYTA
jgi:hypothetical protein